jgi:branched-chain amino acid transport system permease protein
LILLLGVVRIFNFAHGEFYMLGAFITFGCVQFLHWNFFLSIAVGIVAVSLLSLLCYRLIFHHIRGDILLCTAASIGLSMIIQRGALLGFGSQERGLPSPFGGALGVAGVRLPTERVAVILLCLVVMFGLYVLLMRTKLGKAMRAVKLDKEVAALQGINTGRIYLFTFAAGCALAGLAGGIIAPVFSITPHMGHALLLNCFMALTVGGLESMVGGVIGGLVIGTVLSFGSFYLGGLSEILLFAVIGVILVFKPGGLFGEAVAHE